MARPAPRRRFAAPIIAVLGCGRPAPVREATVEELARGPLPVDAPGIVLPDASAAERAERAARAQELEDHCSGRLQPVWNCNPPMPQRLPDAAPAPQPIEARIVQVYVRGSYAVIVADKGSDDGVTRDGKVLTTGDLAVIRIDKHTTHGKLTSTLEVGSGSRVVLVPPSPMRE